MSNTVSASTMAQSSELTPLRAKWGWIVALGVVSLLAGILALGSVVIATVVTVLMVGAMMVVSGIAQIISSFQIMTWGRFLFWLALGVLYVFAGLVVIANPLLSAVSLTLLVGILLIAAGVIRVYIGFRLKSGSPWLWVVVSGVVTSLLGLNILAQWPASSLWALGILLGADLVVSGVSWISVGFGLREGAD